MKRVITVDIVKPSGRRIERKYAGDEDIELRIARYFGLLNDGVDPAVAAAEVELTVTVKEG